METPLEFWRDSEFPLVTLVVLVAIFIQIVV